MFHSAVQMSFIVRPVRLCLSNCGTTVVSRVRLRVSPSFVSSLHSITSEAGASIYSVSPEAIKEMPDLDPNLRSAGGLHGHPE